MTSSDSSPKRANGEPNGADPRPEPAPVANREAATAVRVPHDMDDFLRFLEQVEEIGGKIRKPRTITVGNRFVL